MTENYRNDLLNNAIQIGVELLDVAIIDFDGLHWKTVKEISARKDIELTTNESLYSGVAGIILFYISLYEQTKDEAYVDIICKSGDWLVNSCTKNVPTHGFYSGRMGAIYVLVKISTVTKITFYKEKALSLALSFKDLESVPITQFNLFNGLGGTLLGLLHIHSEFKDYWMLESISQGVELLITNAKSDGIGIYWDLFFSTEIGVSNKPLCSLPLGSSGLGFLFAQFASYFDNSAYNVLSKQCFLYEEQFFNFKKRMWPNFHLSLSDIDVRGLRKAFVQNKLDRLDKEQYSSTWAFGTTGLKLARLASPDLYSGFEYFDQNKESNSILKDKRINYTLATGKLSSAILMFERSKIKNSKTSAKESYDIAIDSIRERQHYGFNQFGYDNSLQCEDSSLFMGSAGIGYTYLYLLKPNINSSILAPQVECKCGDFEHKLKYLKEKEILDNLLVSWYPHSLSVLGSVGVNKIKVSQEAIKESLISNLKWCLKNSNDPILLDAFEYESAQDMAARKISSGYCAFTISTELDKEQNAQLLVKVQQDNFENVTLQLNPYLSIIKTKFPWWDKGIGSVGFKEGSEKLTVLHHPFYKTTIELNEIQQILAECFIAPNDVNSVNESFLAANNFDKTDLEIINNLFWRQIKFLIKANILNYKP